MWRGLVLLALSVVILPSVSCNHGGGPATLRPRWQTWAELRVVRRDVRVHPPEESERAPYPRERLVDGETVHVDAEGLAWLRRDGGAMLLVRGPADLTLRSDAVEIATGRVFVDTPAGLTTEITTPGGPLHLAHVRASVDVGATSTEVYVLAGEVRTEAATRAAAGERLTVTGSGKDARGSVAPVASWDDWTGGLATTDRAAEPAPYGVGTIGARRAGDQGSPRFPLAIQRLDVHVRVDRDFAVTEVDEVFFNPSSETVEGLYRFRTPDGAVLHRFGVDRDGAIMWGHVKEKQAAAAQYQAHVYQGSTEDPALLEWDAPGVYRARLYPIGPGESRRVVVTYAEWLGRTGPKRDRRLYVYPMAAEGPEESLPHIEELYATIDLAHAGAKDVRTGMAGVRDGDLLIVRDHDLVPRADLAVELFDDGLPVATGSASGPSIWRGYQASHAVDVETLAPAERAAASKRARTEADYVLIPLASTIDTDPATKDTGGLDVAIVVDTSAATDTAALAIARAATGALLAHLGARDRAVVWAGDATLRPVVPGKAKLAALDDAGRRDVLSHLAAIERGGATDLGAMLAGAAESLDPSPARRGVVVYVGDGAPTVGELSLVDLQGRLAKLPRPVRIFGLGVGDGAEMGILAGLSRGAFAERIGDANAAARAALRLLEVAERTAHVGATVELGPTVERIYPRDLGALVEGESQVVVGRLVGAPPTSFTVKTAAGSVSVALKVSALDDLGDLSRRWANGRLSQMIDEGVGRAAMVDLGTRHGIITPVTSLYVPTRKEMTTEERADLERRRGRKLGKALRADDGKDKAEEQDSSGALELGKRDADNKEGGTGTRAKGEAASMAAPRAPTAPWGRVEPNSDPSAARGNMWGADIAATAASSTTTRDSPRPPPASPVASPPPPPVAGGVPSAAEPRIARNADEAPPPAAARAPAISEAGDFDRRAEIPSAMDQEMVTESVNGESFGLGGLGTIGRASGGGGHGRLGGRQAGATKDNLKARELTSPAPVIEVRLGELGHGAFRCSGAALLPFEERVALWRERLAGVAGNAAGVAHVYRAALRSCEAPTWRERSRLTSMLLDAMPTVPGKVGLWRSMFGDMGVADALYRGILARVRAPTELRQLHDALGLRSIDPGTLAKILTDAKTPAERVTKLRGLVRVWPDDFALALRLLDTLEDAGDEAGARDLGRTLRARPDADARLRTAVGELYLRLAARAKDPNQKASDEAEARRAFGEIVEFAPDDPIARRRIGDLLRAHGWHAEAARQYETLAKLTPDDPSVALLLASAVQGMGKLEEAVRWTEKGGASGAPDADSGPARTARSFAATWLAWGRLDALNGNRPEEAKSLATRLARLRSTERLSGFTTGTRVTLTWAHPELHPTLWSNALGAMMPAPEGDLTLGIAGANVPVRNGSVVEVRLDPQDVEHAARLGAEAVLTVVFDEDGPTEKIVVTRVAFAGSRPNRRFALSGSSVQEVSP